MHFSLRMRPVGAWILGLSCFFLAPVGGDAQIVHGRVFDQAADSPIPMARVSLLDEEGERVATTLTDAQGRFSLTANGGGSHVLEADRLGYGIQRSETFQVPEEGETRQDLRMIPRAIEVEGVVVEGHPGQLLHEGTLSGVYARRARSPSVGSNRVLVRGDPRFDGAISIGDLLPHPIRPAPYWSARANWCGYLYIDGREAAAWGGDYKAQILSMSPGEVEAIEYYRDLTMAPMAIRPMELPGEMGRARRCGIMAVWTSGAPR